MDLEDFDNSFDYDLSFGGHEGVQSRHSSQSDRPRIQPLPNKPIKQLTGSTSVRRKNSSAITSASFSQNRRTEQRTCMSGDLKQLLDRIRTKANNDVPSDDYVVISGNHNGNRDSKKPYGTAEVHMMKVKLRMQENEVDKVAKEAAMSLQDSERASAQVEVLAKNIKNCNAYDLHQNQKLQACLKQIGNIRKQNAQLEKEVDRLKREVVAMGRDEEKNRMGVALPEIDSTCRLAAINEGVKKETLQVMEDNEKLQESNRKAQQTLLNARRRDQLECKRFMALIHKREVLLQHTRSEREHLEGVRSLHIAEPELRKFFQWPEA
ncbi:hypothetical protein RvY_12644 [Ramazzottius varieornatus]|uniref:Uncharacterized protein n=1 Tax=Ramazzottius varieornatus TaxID=947166 RepID=A0A1D1VM73_RAMVA|nr:hypothetical protein RvY_12644 [Ramazzottius varieornatus]